MKNNFLKIPFFIKFIFFLFLIKILLSGISIFFILVLAFVIPFLGAKLYIQIYSSRYFKSEEFLSIKNEIANYVYECNELNHHIESLKDIPTDFVSESYGRADYIDNSNFNYKRQKLNNDVEVHNVYNCSLNVCRSAKLQPFKYLCKYFNIEINEKNLEILENMLNKFSAAEEGKEILKRKKEEILNSTNIPSIIKNNCKQLLDENLGFYPTNFEKICFPEYIFSYVSPGGNSSMQTKVVLDIYNLNELINYFSELLNQKNSIKGQRALMTLTLRNRIKERDNYTCKKCRVSIYNEPNLLLEIDHILPLSKGGKTTEKNLQTLCWKCNRKKGNKIE